MILIVPGVTGTSSDNYVQDLIIKLHQRGYTSVVMNCLAPKDDEKGFKIADFSDTTILK